MFAKSAKEVADTALMAGIETIFRAEKNSAPKSAPKAVSSSGITLNAESLAKLPKFVTLLVLNVGIYCKFLHVKNILFIFNTFIVLKRGTVFIDEHDWNICAMLVTAVVSNNGTD